MSDSNQAELAGLEMIMRKYLATIFVSLAVIAVALLGLLLKEVTDSNKKIPTLTYDQLGLVQYQACLQSLHSGNNSPMFWYADKSLLAPCAKFLPLATIR